MASSDTKIPVPPFFIRPSSTIPSARYHLVFFITGNPGLIGYYHEFLSTLHALLSNSPDDHNVFHVYGQSLAGFSNDLADRQLPYNLDEQINILFTALTNQDVNGRPYDSVVLIGHSVGSYILLELLNRFRKAPKPLTNIRAGILLFPTVTHIAVSESGLKLTTLLRVPNFPRLASRLAEILLWPIPYTSLKWLVGLVTRMPEASASATTTFLKNDRAIWQALYLAKDEMETIREDRWDADVWGVEADSADTKVSAAKLIFYFGKRDHWVANHTRDALIAARGRRPSEAISTKPLMLVDENRVDHSFCIHHSGTIAERCKNWIDDIMSEEQDLQ